MNDPGLDDPIENSANKVEGEIEGPEDVQKEEEQAFLDPSRWWFASTAFPLLAGTFGPMATAFNICALIEHWRVDIPPGLGANESHGIEVPDPAWLLAINGLSLAFALVANFALLLNMARRLAFSIAQPITIIGWYLASILLLADLTAIIHVVQVPGERRALTQAFYYAIFACALYFVIASLMVYTVYGAWKGHYSKEFKLSMSQRTLMLQTISFMIYMVGGAGVYAKIEGWMFLDALYFTNYTLLTVGIGDYSPSTHLGRGLLFPYAIGGIIILGLVIGSIRTLVLERGKKKIGSRILEKQRRAHLEKLMKKNKAHHLTPIESKQQAREMGMSEQQRREEEFQLMRKIQGKASANQKWSALLISGSAWLFLWFIGALIFYFAEYEQGWSYFGSLYFAYTTLLTIGYGDYKPFSNSGKAFFVFWSLLAVPTLTILISNMGDTVIKGIRDVTLWLGEVTVLPGEEGVRHRLKQILGRATPKKVLRKGIDSKGQSNGLRGDKKEVDAEQAPPRNGVGSTYMGDAEAEDVEEHELTEAGEARLRGDKLGEDIHEYHYLLAQEVRNVMKHINESPPRKYTYKEWAWFLKLMGEDESNPESHRQAPVQVKNALNKDPDIGGGVAGKEKDEPMKEWSWLGNRSPLMGETEEAEWVLERLTATLEGELKKQHESREKDGGRQPGDAEKAHNVMHSNSDGSSDTLGEERKASVNEKSGQMNGSE